MTERTCRTYAEFWLYYLREHSRPQTRAIHYAGTALVIAFAVLLFVTGNGWWALAMPFTGYGFAWAAISSSSATAPRLSPIRFGRSIPTSGCSSWR